MDLCTIKNMRGSKGHSNMLFDLKYRKLINTSSCVLLLYVQPHCSTHILVLNNMLELCTQHYTQHNTHNTHNTTHTTHTTHNTQHTTHNTHNTQHTQHNSHAQHPHTQHTHSIHPLTHNTPTPHTTHPLTHNSPTPPNILSCLFCAYLLN
jgi:hypothetical protein